MAILVLALPALALIALAAVLGIPALLRQLDQLIDQVPTALERIVAWLGSLDERLRRVDIPLIAEEQLIERLRAEFDAEEVFDTPSDEEKD